MFVGCLRMLYEQQGFLDRWLGKWQGTAICVQDPNSGHKTFSETLNLCNEQQGVISKSCLFLKEINHRGPVI